MNRKLVLVYLMVFLCLGFMNHESVVFAGITGKIAGVIRDAETQEPMIGANIILRGTYLGAATDSEGRYTIINVPPGEYVLEARMMGYKTFVVENFLVKIDLTTTINANLESTVIDAAEVVTVVAERPLVQPDMTSSMASMGATEIEKLPVQSVGDILELQAGVVREGGDFHIRGGRANEVAFWVDGVETTDAYSGESMGITVEKNAIQELQLVSGTFNAEYGKALSGIVNVITKEGTKKYSGEIDTYVGDYMTSDPLYSILSSVDKSIGSDGNLVEVEERENPLKKLNMTLNTELSLSGPVPFTKNKVSFFTTGRYVYEDGYLYGRKWFTPQGLAGDSSLVPLDAETNYSGLGKLTFHVLPSLKFNYQIMYDRSHSDIDYSKSSDSDRLFRYVPGGLRQNNYHGLTHIFSLTHTISQNTFYEARISRLYRESKQYLYEDPLKMPHWLVRIPADTLLGTEEYIVDPFTTEGKAQLDALDNVEQGWYFIDPNNQEGYVDSDYLSGQGNYNFYKIGTRNNRSFRTYGFWTAKLDLTSQITSNHQVKTGIEFKFHELERDNYTLIEKKIGNEEIFPFTPEIPSEASLSRDKYKVKPREFSAYIQDKIELKEMIVNVGLRFDYFNANATIPSDPTDPDIYNPFRSEHKYKDVDQQIEYTPEERMDFMRTKVDPKMKLSPRIGIAYPITDRGTIHFSYGHFLGMPGLQYLYNQSQFKLTSGGGNTLIGNPNLEPERIVQYELGVQQQLGVDIGLDVTVFYKDARGYVGASPLKETFLPSVSYSQYENKDYSQVYGFTLDLEKRFSSNFSANLYYSFQVAEGTYSDPRDAYNAIEKKEEPRLALIPMNWDQRHTLNTYLSYSHKGWIVALTGKLETGQPYTPTISKAERTGKSNIADWRENSAILPTTNSVDLRILKSIPLGAIKLELYTIIYNLFDQRGERNVYSETGTADYSADLDINYHLSKDLTRIGSYNEFGSHPEWYQAPRHVQLGAAVRF